MRNQCACFLASVTAAIFFLSAGCSSTQTVSAPQQVAGGHYFPATCEFMDKSQLAQIITYKKVTPFGTTDLVQMDVDDWTGDAAENINAVCAITSISKVGTGVDKGHRLPLYLQPGHYDFSFMWILVKMMPESKKLYKAEGYLPVSLDAEAGITYEIRASMAFTGSHVRNNHIEFVPVGITTSSSKNVKSQ